MLRRHFVIWSLAVLGVVTSQCAAQQPKTVRLATVGNSFSQDATRHLPGLVKAAGHTLEHRQLSIGGASMQVHWDKAQLFEKDPTDAKALYGTKKSLKQDLSEGNYDFITIQQASIKSHDIATYRPYAKLLHDYIKAAAPKSQILIHETWAYRVDDPRFKPTKSPSEPATQKAMYDGLKKSYETIAAELGLKIIPVGDAFFMADTDPKWGYKPDASFDAKSAKAPTLPNQTHSLHVGRKWSTPKDGGAPALGMDGHHASSAGQYLGACVFFEMLFGESPVGNTYIPKDLDRDYARFLQETANRAVTRRKSP